jgi:hypothetical protein
VSVCLLVWFIRPIGKLYLKSRRAQSLINMLTAVFYLLNCRRANSGCEWSFLFPSNSHIPTHIFNIKGAQKVAVDYELLQQ